MKKIIYTKNTPEPVGPYSQAVMVNGILFCSGQIALNPQTGSMVQDSIQAETQQIMKNINEVLIASGVGFQEVFKTTIYLTSMSDFATVNEVYGSFFKFEPPARSTVAVKELPKGARVEIEVTAALSK